MDGKAAREAAKLDFHERGITISEILMADQDKDPFQPASSEASEDVYGVIPPDSEPDCFPPHIEELFTPKKESETEAEEPDEETPLTPFQFTLKDMFLLMIGMSVCLSAMSMLRWSWPVAAGVAGVAAFVSLIVLNKYEPENTSVRFAWMSIFVVYLITCLAAMVIR